MILLSELSRRRIRSVQKLIRVGRDEVVVVLRVDEEKGKKKQAIISRKVVSLNFIYLKRLYRFIQASCYS